MSTREPFPVVCAWDPAIDPEHSNTAEYYDTRDIALLKFLPEKRPVIFYLRDLDTRAVNRFVLAGVTDTDQCERAFRACVVRVDGLELDNGHVADQWEPKRVEKLAHDQRMTETFDLFVDKELVLFDPATVQEIGTVARSRFFCPRAIELIYRLPDTSLQILGMKLYRAAVPAKSSLAAGEQE